MITIQATQLADRVLDAVSKLSLRMAVSYWVTAPPFCGGGCVPNYLKTRIEECCDGVRIATIAADGIRDTHDFLVQLEEQWHGDVARGPVEQQAPRLGRILRSDSGPYFLIVNEFHKILDALDERVLSDLREAEQAGRLVTVVFTKYALSGLRNHWHKAGRLLYVSNYGDQHQQITLEPAGRDETVEYCTNLHGFDAGAAIFRATGGLVELVTWLAADCLASSPGRAPVRVCEEELELRLVPRFKEMLRRIDECTNTGTHYFECLKEFVLQEKSLVDLVEELRGHPWARALVTESGLRSGAASRAIVELACESGCDTSSPHARAVELGRRAYGSERYTAAASAFGSLISGRADGGAPEHHLAHINSQIMEILSGPDEQRLALISDVDWSGLRGLLHRAQKELRRLATDTPETRRLERRYDALEQLATKIIAIRKSNHVRIVDALAGLRPIGEPSHLAYTVLLQELQLIRGIGGPSAAVKNLSHLPEQCARVVAYWAFELSFYQAPGLSVHTLEEWRLCFTKIEPRRPMRIPEEGGQFQSMPEFLALLYALDRASGSRWLWKTDADFKGDAGFLAFRNDPSHGTVAYSSKRHEAIRAHVEEWVGRVERLCISKFGIGHDAAREVTAPLPLFKLPQ